MEITSVLQSDTACPIVSVGRPIGKWSWQQQLLTGADVKILEIWRQFRISEVTRPDAELRNARFTSNRVLDVKFRTFESLSWITGSQMRSCASLHYYCKVKRRRVRFRANYDVKFSRCAIFGKMPKLQ